MLTRRLQVLIDETRYERLAKASERLGAPVGELVRRATAFARSGAEDVLASREGEERPAGLSGLTF